jgi:hypothetical protein
MGRERRKKGGNVLNITMDQIEGNMSHRVVVYHNLLSPLVEKQKSGRKSHSYSPYLIFRFQKSCSGSDILELCVISPKDIGHVLTAHLTFQSCFRTFFFEKQQSPRPRRKSSPSSLRGAQLHVRARKSQRLMAAGVNEK